MSPVLRLLQLALAPTPEEVRRSVREACGTEEKYRALVHTHREAADGLVAKLALPRAEVWAALKVRLARDGDDVALACVMAAELEESEAAIREA